METMLRNMDQHLWLSLAIPAAFLLITGIVKSLVRTELTWGNFYLGLDAALAALANGIVNVVDIVRNVECGDQVATAAAATARQSRTYFTAAFICIAFFVLLIVMMIHQRQESAKTPVERMKNRWKRGIWLGLVANLIGSGMLLLFLFIYMRLKGTL